MMGAKNHAVVMPDAPQEPTLNSLLGAAFGAAGQRCMAASTVVMVGKTHEWIAALVARARALKVNAGTEAGTDLGPVVSKTAAKRITDLIEQGVAQGAKLELDGRGI